MKDPHNYKQVGFAMIVVAASLSMVGILGVMIGDDVLYSDKIQRGKSALFEQCKEIDFKHEKCEVFMDRVTNPTSGLQLGE